ncbi:NTP pyrophosphohydrolase, partial [Modestobacter roseus]|nr:NTP pyrophosphohydrolase [Modestobacter roseus]
ELADGDDDVLVVTADRGLRARLPAAARVTGPGWLLAAADSVTGQDQAP